MNLFDILDDLEKNDKLSDKDNLAIKVYFNQLTRAGQIFLKSLWMDTNNIQDIISLVPVSIDYYARNNI